VFPTFRAVPVDLAVPSDLARRPGRSLRLTSICQPSGLPVVALPLLRRSFGRSLRPLI
jgi:hypothetical protein